MKLRLAAVATASLALALGVTGCNMLTPQATTFQYNPGDGFNAESGDVAIRNALLVVDPEDTTRASLNVTFVNQSDATVPVTVTVGNSETQVQVESGANVFGFPDNQLIFTLPETTPGARVNTAFLAGDGESVGLQLQVISTEAVGYEDLGPTAEPEATE